MEIRCEQDSLEAHHVNLHEMINQPKPKRKIEKPMLKIEKI